MTRCSHLWPIPIKMEMQNPIVLTPEKATGEVKGRRSVMGNFLQCSPAPLRPFVQRAQSVRALPARPYLQYTPDSPENAFTPERPFHAFKPTQLHFSPATQNTETQDSSSPLHGLMYADRQALREPPWLITNVEVIYASPILQENIHNLLADHALDEVKTRETIRYLGLQDEPFFYTFVKFIHNIVGLSLVTNIKTGIFFVIHCYNYAENFL